MPVDEGRDAEGPAEEGAGRPRAGRGEIEAPAKVNLVLRVLERDQATGYHRLDTVFQAVGLCDRLVVEVGDGRAEGPGGVELEVVGSDVGPPGDNLVTRAAEAFLAGAGVSVPVRIRLEKRIPAGAGLGGGSSDGAATLRVLNGLFGQPLSASALHEIGGSLGSDVPFFLCGSATARGGGRGDVLDPLPFLPSRPVLLVLPDVHVATGAAYEALARGRRAGREKARPEKGPSLDWDRLARGAVNDFEAVVPAAHPPVARALEAVRSTAPMMALLSGSGSAVFAVYGEEPAASAARDELEAAGHRIVATRTLEQMPEAEIA